MKDYSQITLIEAKSNHKNALIGFIPSKNKPYSSMCILGLLQAFITENHDFLTVFLAMNYKTITFYLNKEILKNVYG